LNYIIIIIIIILIIIIIIIKEAKKRICISSVQIVSCMNRATIKFRFLGKNCNSWLHVPKLQLN
jgi:hypothetical protein